MERIWTGRRNEDLSQNQVWKGRRKNKDLNQNQNQNENENQNQQEGEENAQFQPSRFAQEIAPLYG